jgi:hypothetical protein
MAGIYLHATTYGGRGAGRGRPVFTLRLPLRGPDPVLGNGADNLPRAGISIQN